MGRACPVCGKGMFTRKQLIQHIKHKHPAYYNKWIANSPRYSICHSLIRARKKGKDIKVPPQCLNQ